MLTARAVDCSYCEVCESNIVFIIKVPFNLYSNSNSTYLKCK